MSEKVMVTIKIPKHMSAQLSQLLKKTDKTRSVAIREAIETWMHLQQTSVNINVPEIRRKFLEACSILKIPEKEGLIHAEKTWAEHVLLWEERLREKEKEKGPKKESEELLEAAQQLIKKESD